MEVKDDSLLVISKDLLQELTPIIYKFVESAVDGSANLEERVRKIEEKMKGMEDSVTYDEAMKSIHKLQNDRAIKDSLKGLAEGVLKSFKPSIEEYLKAMDDASKKSPK